MSVKFFWCGFTRFAGKFLFTGYSLVFVIGFLASSLLYFYVEDAYEKKIFETLSLYIKNKTPDTLNREEALLLNCLHLTNSLCKNRATVFSKEIGSFKSSVIHPVSYDLISSSGACGSNSYILSRLLNELKITNRIGQMKVGNLYSGHVVVEAKTSKGWVVLDGSYDLYFKKAGGQLASFKDVQHNWSFYRTQVPSDYKHQYKYEGVRYTNWDKIPVVTPALKSILMLVVGKEAVNELSLRTFFLRKFHLLFQLTVFICLTIFVVVIYNYTRKKTLTARKAKRFLTVPDKKSLLVKANELTENVPDLPAQITEHNKRSSLPCSSRV
jgi:hypothetical protein